MLHLGRESTIAGDASHPLLQCATLLVGLGGLMIGLQAQTNGRFAAIEQRIMALEERVGGVEQRLAAVEAGQTHMMRLLEGPTAHK